MKKKYAIFSLFLVSMTGTSCIFFPPLLPVHSRNGKLYPLGDVCGVVADAFKVFGYHQNVYSIFSGIWVLVDYADEVDSLSPQHSLFQEFLS